MHINLKYTFKKRCKKSVSALLIRMASRAKTTITIHMKRVLIEMIETEIEVGSGAEGAIILFGSIQIEIIYSNIFRVQQCVCGG